MFAQNKFAQTVNFVKKRSISEVFRFFSTLCSSPMKTFCRAFIAQWANLLAHQIAELPDCQTDGVYMQKSSCM